MANLVTWTHVLQEEGIDTKDVLSMSSAVSRTICAARWSSFSQQLQASSSGSASSCLLLILNDKIASNVSGRSPDVHRCQAQLSAWFKFVLDLRYDVK